MDIETIQKAESEDDGQWQMERAEKPSHNSTKLHGGDNSKRNITKQNLKTEINRVSKRTRGIYTQKGFCTGNMDPSGNFNERHAPTYRLLSGDPEAMKEQERDNERIRLKEQERANKLEQEKDAIENSHE